MRFLILMPVRDALEPATMTALTAYTDGYTPAVFSETGLPVDVARNTLARRALAVTPEPDAIVWADADTFWEPGTFRHLAARVATMGPHDLLVAFHGPRRPWAPMNAAIAVPGGFAQLTIPALRAAPDGLAEVVFGGSHFYVHKPALLRALGPAPWDVLGAPSEDSAFCMAVRRIGGRIAVDARLVVYHVEGDLGYLPGRGRFAYAAGVMTPLPDAPPARVEDVRNAAWRSYGERVDTGRTVHFAARGIDEEAVRAQSLPAPGELDRRSGVGVPPKE